MDAFLTKHLQGVSRTYAIVVPMLPRPLDEAVGLAYLLMRIVDTIEDAPHLGPADRMLRLATLDAAMSDDRALAARLAEPIGDHPAEAALMHDTPEVLARIHALAPAHRNAIFACARNMGSGVCRLLARSLKRGRPYPAVRDLAELREYCYYVAGTVGEMLCAMMAHHLERPDFRAQNNRAIELGTGLQLVNILKDARADAVHGRRYLPMIAGPGAPATQIYGAALNEARRCLTVGIDYILALPATATALRQFCGLPVAWGALTLARAAEDPAAAKISREDIGQSIERFTQLAGDDAALRTWLGALLDATSPTATAPAKTVSA